MKTNGQVSGGSKALRGRVSFFETLGQLDTEEQCIRHLEQVRWPDGLVCIKEDCRSRRIMSFETKGKTGKARHLYECVDCRYQYSITTGTIFHNSHLPLNKWFLAIHLISSTKRGISAKDLERKLKVNYRTACYMMRRLRLIIQSATD